MSNHTVLYVDSFYNFFKLIYSSDSESPNTISAVRLTLPATTHLPIRFIISTIVVTDIGSPTFLSTASLMELCTSSNGL